MRQSKTYITGYITDQDNTNNKLDYEGEDDTAEAIHDFDLVDPTKEIGVFCNNLPNFLPLHYISIELSYPNQVLCHYPCSIMYYA